MSASQPDVALLVVPEVAASTLYGIHDVLCSAGRDWATLIEGRPGRSLLQPRVVAAAGARPVRVANGVRVKPDGDLQCVPDVVCVPEVAVPPDAPLLEHYSREIEWLQHCYAAGSMIATACSGAMLLGASGLLEGQDATTHWAYCDALARFRDVRVYPNRSLVVSGHGGRLIMAGGGTSWEDLALYLVARLVDVEEAMRVARLFLIDWHDAGQLPFAAVARSTQTEDAVIADCQSWIAENYDVSSPVSAMISRCGLSERSFNRRFTKATGASPMDYVHTLRLEESKQMLEAGDEPVDAIANAVGYEDSAFFGRLFRRKVGLTPMQYRRRFGGMRSMLQR